jgi:hypothetical protein
MLDSNVYDAIAMDDELKTLVRQRQDEGRIAILSTTIVAGELAKIPNSKNVGQGSVVSTHQVGTPAFILGVCTLGTDDLGGHPLYDLLCIGNPKHTNDALIGAAAFKHAEILVTNERPFANRFRRHQNRARVMTPAEFRSFLEAM